MKKKNSIVEMGVANLIGVGMIGATAGMVNDLPAGTAKDIAKMTPGLMSVSLVSHNLKPLKQKISNKKIKW